MTEPTPTPDGVTPDGTPAPDADPKPVTAEDLARVTAALEKERELRKERDAELRQFRTQAQASMTETERALAEAEERGRADATVKFGERLARSAFVAEAAKRNAGFDASAVLDDLNFAKYIGEDGEPNTKELATLAERLVPAGTSSPSTPRPDPSQGPRTTASGSTADQFAAAINGFL